MEIYNPDYSEGSVLSMAVSLRKLESCSPFALLLDGDVLYDTRMLRPLTTEVRCPDFRIEHADGEPA